MPREARLFTSSAGSVVRGYLKFRANIPPRWIENARGSRKRIEPDIAEGFRSLKCLRAMSSHPGEKFTMPLPEKMVEVRQQCHEVMKD
jgi:hypothetical protein